MIDTLVFENYESEDARVLEAASCEMDIAMAEAEFMLEMVEKREHFNNLRSELKVYAEGGTYDDLGELYAEAAGESSNQECGIICKLITGIKNFISKIINSIKNLFSSSKVPDETVASTDCAGPGEFLSENRKLIAVMAAAAASTAVFMAKKDSIAKKFEDLKKSYSDWKSKKGTMTVGKARRELKQARADLDVYTKQLDDVQAAVDALNHKYPDKKTMPADKKNELKGHQLMVKLIGGAVQNENKSIAWLTDVIEKAESAAYSKKVRKEGQKEAKKTANANKRNTNKNKPAAAAQSDADDEFDTTGGAMRAANESADDDIDGMSAFESSDLDSLMDLINSL